jgi:predicted  nucleic acid-binding Zn-ribbon protein
VTDTGAMAEAIERARVERLRQGTWTELREGERATRVQIALDAMLTSGVAAEIDALSAQADRVGPLLETLGRRELEAARELELHDKEIVRLSDTIAALDDRVGALSRALAEAQARAESAEQVLMTVREAVALRPAAAPLLP